MYCVIYSFEVNPEEEAKFKTAWKELTTFIFKNDGSLGSRLHHAKANTFIAYAQWPSRKAWEESRLKSNPEADLIGTSMREACVKIETIYQLDVVDDLLTNKVYDEY